jgi:DNA (cytosine-5)-methyltransferase 1
MKIIRVIELFAGVGGFRIGLEKASNQKVKYETVWNNQWEPSTKIQHASEIYQKQFGSKGHSCEDIRKVVDEKFETIPEHDLLVGGFPCQDYSVARTANQADGLIGKKGVLWWSIFNILKKSRDKSANFIMLENVDRLLKSPTKHRGRDFAVMLSSLSSLNYVIEWRVINAADYGFPQRRRRVFIMAYKDATKPNKEMRETNPNDWIEEKGLIAKAFPISKSSDTSYFEIDKDPAKVSEDFSKNSPKLSPFYNAGVVIDGKVYTKKVTPKYSGDNVYLKDIIQKESEVPHEFFINENDLERWEYLKGGKKEKRKTKDGFEYEYTEGGMIFPDNLESPARTIVTGEGGSSPSRFKHVIKTPTGRLRRLTPIELERINMFPDEHTDGVSNTKRAFLMGNALVTGIVEKLGESLREI